MNSVRRSIFFSAVERYGSILLFFVATAILSRLLTPKEFGTYAVVNAVITVIAAPSQEFGGTNYLIQKHELSRGSIRTAFTVTLCISTLIGLALLASAGGLSRYFGQSGVGNGIAVSALGFLLAPFSGTISALFRRNMEFGKLAACTLAANSIGAVISVVLAVCDFSYMAPVWGNLAANAVLAIMLLVWYCDIGIFRPSLRQYRDIVGFGLYSSGTSLINVFYNLAPQIFLAKILDFAAVGLYSRAMSMTQVFDRFIAQVLAPVIMPAIVAQNRAGANLKHVYLDSMRLLSAVQWPSLLFIALMAPTIILIWLGPNWLDIVPLVRILCIANMALFAACLSYPMLVAVGRVRDALVSSLITLPPSILLVLCASFFGVQMVAAAALLTLPFQATVAIYFIGRQLDIRPREIVGALLKSAIVTVTTAAGVAGCAALVETAMIGPYLGLISAFFVAAFCWWAGLALTEHPLLAQLYQTVNGFTGIVAPRLRLRGVQ
jgi:O-antigen/teichoic acid export membrane protein